MDSPSRKRVTLFGAEVVRPAACCVEDALAHRGWEVALETGPHARGALLRKVRERDPGLLVLCVPGRFDPQLAARMRARLDPDCRVDLHVVSIETPRSVIEAVEQIGGVRPASRPKRPKRPVRVLAHPTLVEQQVGRERIGWAAVAATAVLMLGVLGLDATSSGKSQSVHMHEARSVTVAAKRPDEPVLSASIRIPRALEETQRSGEDESIARSPARTSSISARGPQPDGPVDFARLGPAPLEDVPRVVRPHTLSAVPGMRPVYTIDPFAD